MELTNEIHSLRAESKQHEKSMHEYGGIQKRHETLLREVRTLEGALADYNLAMDKDRVGDSYRFSRIILVNHLA